MNKSDKKEDKEKKDEIYSPSQSISFRAVNDAKEEAEILSEENSNYIKESIIEKHESSKWNEDDHYQTAREVAKARIEIDTFDSKLSQYLNEYQVKKGIPNDKLKFKKISDGNYSIQGNLVKLYLEKGTYFSKKK